MTIMIYIRRKLTQTTLTGITARKRKSASVQERLLWTATFDF